MKVIYLTLKEARDALERIHQVAFSKIYQSRCNGEIKLLTGAMVHLIGNYYAFLSISDVEMEYRLRNSFYEKYVKSDRISEFELIDILNGYRIYEKKGDIYYQPNITILIREANASQNK